MDLKYQLSKVIPLSGGGSYKLLYDMLYHIRLLKYVRQPQLKLINPRYAKICSLKKLTMLAEIGLIKNTNQDIYVSTVKSLELLKELDYPVALLPKNISGEGGINEINNTNVFIQALKLPDFKTLLYPSFDYIRPDALLVRAEGNRYKLEFLEVEEAKPDWTNWLENKRVNYLRLAEDKQVYSYWKDKCYHLGLVAPERKDFKFSISIVGKLKLDFGNGFNFKEVLN